jgi:hypothetical protein
MKRAVLSLTALAGLVIVLAGIALWHKANPSYVTTRPYDREPY